MPMYHLVFKGLPERPVRSVTFYGESPAEALEVARRQDGPAEFWIESQYICTLRRSGENGDIWVISGEDESLEHESIDHALDPDVATGRLRSA